MAGEIYTSNDHVNLPKGSYHVTVEISWDDVADVVCYEVRQVTKEQISAEIFVTIENANTDSNCLHSI